MKRVVALSLLLVNTISFSANQTKTQKPIKSIEDALERSDVEKVKTFLEAGENAKGFDKDLLESDEHEPRVFAAQTVVIAELMLKHGADLTLRNSEGETVLHAVAQGKKHAPELIDLYSRHGANSLAVDQQGYTPLAALILCSNDWDSSAAACKKAKKYIQQGVPLEFPIQEGKYKGKTALQLLEWRHRKAVCPERTYLHDVQIAVKRAALDRTVEINRMLFKLLPPQPKKRLITPVILEYLDVQPQ